MCSLSSGELGPQPNAHSASLTQALHQPKTQGKFAPGEENNQNFQGPDFFLKFSKGKFVFYCYFICIFVHIVRGQPFLMISDDQTSLRSVLCPTSDLTCGVTMFIIISKEKKNLVKKAKTTTKKQSYSEHSSNFFCVCT